MPQQVLLTLSHAFILFQLLKFPCATISMNLDYAAHIPVQLNMYWEGSSHLSVARQHCHGT